MTKIDNQEKEKFKKPSGNNSEKQRNSELPWMVETSDLFKNWSPRNIHRKQK